MLIEWPGTLLLVSHDRAFIDNVVTSTLVFEGGGRVQEYVGGYEDWLRQRRTPAAETRRGPRRRASDALRPPRDAGAAAKKPTYREQQELAAAAGADRSPGARTAAIDRSDGGPRLLQGAGRDHHRTLARLEMLQK